MYDASSLLDAHYPGKSAIQRAVCAHKWANLPTVRLLVRLSLNSTGPTRTLTPTPTSSPTSARGSSCGRRRVRRARKSTAEAQLVGGLLFDARISSRGCPLEMRACVHVYVYCRPIHDKLSCTRLQNYTIGASIKSVSVSGA